MSEKQIDIPWEKQERSMSELAYVLGKSERYIFYLKQLGLEMPGGTTTIEKAKEFIKKHPKPCTEVRKRNQDKKS